MVYMMSGTQQANGENKMTSQVKKLIQFEIRDALKKGLRRPSEISCYVQHFTGQPLHLVTTVMQDVLSVRTMVATDTEYIAHCS